VRHVDDPHGWLARAEVGGPGFVNVRFTPAFWRALFADGLAAGEAWGGSTGDGGRAEVRVVAGAPGADPLTVGRAMAVAEATARLLAARGDAVEGAGAPAGLGGAPGRWRVAVHRAGACEAVVPIGEVRVISPPGLGRETGLMAAGADAVRFFLLRRAPALPLDLDLALAARQGTESPFFSVAYALVRIARLGTPPAAVAPDALDEAEMPVVRAAVRLPDVVEAAAQIAPHVLANFAVELAAAFHRYYNRCRIVTGDPERSMARLALACGVARILRAALGLLGVGLPGRG